MTILSGAPETTDTLLNLGVLLRRQNSELGWVRLQEVSVPFLEFPLLVVSGEEGHQIREKGLGDRLSRVCFPPTQLPSCTQAVFSRLYLQQATMYQSCFPLKPYCLCFLQDDDSPELSVTLPARGPVCRHSCGPSMLSLWVLQCFCCLLCCKQ